MKIHLEFNGYKILALVEAVILIFVFCWLFKAIRENYLLISKLEQKMKEAYFFDSRGKLVYFYKVLE